MIGARDSRGSGAYRGNSQILTGACRRLWALEDAGKLEGVTSGRQNWLRGSDHEEKQAIQHSTWISSNGAK